MRFTPDERKLLAYTSQAHAVSDAWHLLFPALLFVMAADFNNDYLFLGLMANAMVAARGVSGVVAGFLADTYSSRRLFAAFGVLCCLGCLAISTSSGRAALLLGLILLGLGTGIYHPVGLSAITRSVTRRAEGLGIHGLAGSVGASALPVAAISIGIAFTWKTSFAVGAVVSLSVLALLPLVPSVFDRPVKRPGDPLLDLRGMVRSLTRGPLIALYGVSILIEFSLIGFLTFLTTAIAAYAGFGQESIAGLSTTGLFATLVIAVGGVGAFFGGRLGERFSSESVLFASTLMAVPALLLLGVAKGAFLLALTPVIGLMFLAQAPQIGALLGRFLPGYMHGKGFALLYGTAQALGSLAGLLGGAVAQQYGVNWVFPILALVLLCSLPLQLSLLWSRRTRRNLPIVDSLPR